MAKIALKSAILLNEMVNWPNPSKKAEIRQVLELEIVRVDRKSREDLQLKVLEPLPQK